MTSAYHSQPILPSGASHALFLNLSFPAASSSSSATRIRANANRGTLISQLVTARNDVLRVYNVYQTDASGVRLYLIKEHTVFGAVTGLERVSTIATEHDGRDRLLVSFKDAKMALMEWCNSIDDLETVSIHTYERAPQLADGLPDIFIPILNADPSSRCAALLLPQDALAILPFYQDLSDLDFYDLEQSNTNADLAGMESLPYSPSFVLPFHEVDPKIKNVRDFCFLPGFQKPTVAVLFQQLFTWSGRLAVHKDTAAIYIFTLDLTASMAENGADAEMGLQALHPVLASSTGLPFDSLYLVPCPASLGGVLAVTMSALLHIDQSGRIVVTALNEWFPTLSGIEAESTLKLEGVDDLQNSQLTFTDTTEGILTLQDGSVCRFWCVMDGRSVEGIRVERASLASQTSGLAEEGDLVQTAPPSAAVVMPCGRPYIFAASMAGDSTLFRFEKVKLVMEKQEEGEDVKQEQEQHNDMDLDLDEDLYGDSAAADSKAARSSGTSYKEVLQLTEVDRLEAYGSIIKVARRLAPASDSGLGRVSQLVASTGAGAGAGLTYFEARQGPKKKRRLDIRPCQSVWKVASASGDRTKVVCSSEHESKTEVLVLDPAGEIVEVKKIQGHTLAAGSLHSFSEMWARVTGSSLQLIGADGNVEQEIHFDGAMAVSGSIEQGGYASIRLLDGSHQLYKLDAKALRYEPLALPEELANKQLVSWNVVADHHHLFQEIGEARVAQATSKSKGANGVAAKTTRKTRAAKTFAVDDEDEIDYGDDDADQEMNGHDAAPVNGNGSHAAAQAAPAPEGEGMTYLFTTDSEGVCEIYSLPGFSLCWKSHSLPALSDRLNLEVKRNYQLAEEHVVKIKESRLCHLGDTLSLVTLTESNLLMVHQANHLPNEEGGSGSDPASVDSTMLSLGFNKVLATTLSPNQLENEDTSHNGYGKRGVRLQPYGHQSGSVEDAVAILGAGLTSGTSWLFSTSKEGVFFVDAEEEESAVDDLCWVGPNPEDLLICSEGSIYLASFEHNKRFSGGWAYETFRTGRTYTNLASHDVTGCVVAASVIDSHFALFDDENELVRDPAADPTKIISQTGALELFVDDDKHEPIDGYEFEANETVCSLEIVALDSPSVPEGRKKFVAVGTATNYGEDRAAKGSTYLFDIVEVVASAADPCNRYRLKLLCRDDLKAPVTALADLNGFLISTSGQKLYVRALEKEEWLISVAFLDVGYFVTSIRVVKNFLLLSDIQKSIWFVGFQEEPYRFVILGKDHSEQHVTTGNFLVNGNRLSLVSSSGTSGSALGKQGVLRIFEYAPNVPSSLGGQRLLLRTEYQSAAPEAVQSYLVKGRWLRGEEPEGNETVRSKVVYGMSNGSIETLAAIDDKVVKRLQLLQGQLVRTIQHVAVLNPRGFRAVRNDSVSRPLVKGIIDGRLVSLFERLPRPKMLEIVSTLAGVFDGLDEPEDDMQQEEESEADKQIQRQEQRRRRTEAKRADLILADLVRLRLSYETI